jgi:hypothetical protein
MVQPDVGVPRFEFVAYRELYAAARATGRQPGFVTDRQVAEQRNREAIGGISLQAAGYHVFAGRPAVSGQ